MLNAFYFELFFVDDLSIASHFIPYFFFVGLEIETGYIKSMYDGTQSSTKQYIEMYYIRIFFFTEHQHDFKFQCIHISWENSIKKYQTKRWEEASSTIFTVYFAILTRLYYLWFEINDNTQKNGVWKIRKIRYCEIIYL